MADEYELETTEGTCRYCWRPATLVWRVLHSEGNGFHERRLVAVLCFDRECGRLRLGRARVALVGQ